jgi:unsaturated chondroitin disaccharide hydrolase
VIHFSNDTGPVFTEALRVAQQKVRKLIENNPDLHPLYTKNGRWKHEGIAWTHWCDGFLPGIMWIFRRRAEAGSKDAAYWDEQAIRYTKPLESRKLDTDVHDLGFIFMSSYHRWYALTKDRALNEVLVEAGRTLARRFKDKGGYLRSFVGDDSLFIDIMMNVGIIFYAARETGDRRLREIALKHCFTTRRFLIRGDGSAAHEGIFDIETGEFLRQSTQQGWRSDSCWSRGLAWAMYGFSRAYEYSRDPHFLETAQQTADYYISHCPSDGVPPWDFNAPLESRKLVDTSAAAIMASGLFRLCRFLSDPIKGHFYWSTANRILRSLCDKYLAKGDSRWEGILKGGVYHIHKELGVDESVMWGEYFFVEALDQALRGF